MADETVQMNLRIDRAIADELKARAEEEERTLAATATRAFRKYLARDIERATAGDV